MSDPVTLHRQTYSNGEEEVFVTLSAYEEKCAELAQQTIYLEDRIAFYESKLAVAVAVLETLSERIINVDSSAVPLIRETLAKFNPASDQINKPNRVKGESDG